MELIALFDFIFRSNALQRYTICIKVKHRSHLKKIDLRCIHHRYLIWAKRNIILEMVSRCGNINEMKFSFKQYGITCSIKNIIEVGCGLCLCVAYTHITGWYAYVFMVSNMCMWFDKFDEIVSERSLFKVILRLWLISKFIEFLWWNKQCKFRSDCMVWRRALEKSWATQLLNKLIIMMGLENHIADAHVGPLAFMSGPCQIKR